MTALADLPEVTEGELSRDVTLKRYDDHLKATFYYAGPDSAILAETLLKIMGLLFGIYLLADAAEGYTAGTALAHRSLGASLLPWAYDIYSLPKPFLAELVFGQWGSTVGLVSAAVSLGAFLIWLVIGQVLSAFEALPKLFARVVRWRRSVSFYPDKIAIGRKQFPLLELNQGFALIESGKVRNRTRKNRMHERSKELVFVNGANRVSIATIYGVDRATGIQNSLQHIKDHFM